MLGNKQVFWLVLLIIGPASIAQAAIKDRTVYPTKDSIRPNIVSLRLVPTHTLPLSSAWNPQFDPRDFNTVVAEVRFMNSCMAGKFEAIGIDFSVGLQKPVQEYLLVLNDIKPGLMCGEIAPELSEQYLYDKKFAVAVLPKNIKQVRVNEILATVE